MQLRGPRSEFDLFARPVHTTMTSGTDREFASSGKSLDIYKRASTARVLDLGFWGLTLSLAIGGAAVLVGLFYKRRSQAGRPCSYLDCVSWLPVVGIP